MAPGPAWSWVHGGTVRRASDIASYGDPMTDEQVDRIVSALGNNSGDSLLTTVVAIASVVLGFVLSQGAEWWKTRHVEKQRLREKRYALIERPVALQYKVGGMSAAQLRQDPPMDEIAARLGAFHGFGPEGTSVGAWWMTQMSKLASQPTGSKEFSAAESAERFRVGNDIVSGLQNWASGRTKMAWFERFIDHEHKLLMVETASKARAEGE